MVRNLKKCDWDLFKETLQEPPDIKVWLPHALDEAAKWLQEEIIRSLDVACPVRPIRTTRPVPWWNKEVAGLRA